MIEIGDKMDMEYDYGAGWAFDIELVSVQNMKQATGTHYPSITASAGVGIIEDLPAEEWIDYINQVDETGAPPVYYDICDKEVSWDYKRFDLKTLNILLKGSIQRMKENYEEY